MAEKRVEVFFISKDGCANLPVWVFDHDGDGVLGLVVDLSLGGAQVMLPKMATVPEGAHRIHLQALESHGFNGCDLPIEVKWHRPATHVDYQLIGCSFPGLEAEPKGAVEQLMAAIEAGEDPHLHLRCVVI